jgi:hypothetical protein
MLEYKQALKQENLWLLSKIMSLSVCMDFSHQMFESALAKSKMRLYAILELLTDIFTWFSWRNLGLEYENLVTKSMYALLLQKSSNRAFPLLTFLILLSVDIS